MTKNTQSTALKHADTVGNQYTSSKANGKYIVADVTVKNNGDESITIDTNLFNILNGEATNKADGTASTNANSSSGKLRRNRILFRTTQPRQ